MLAKQTVPEAKCNPESLIKGIVKVASLPAIYSKIEEALAGARTSNSYLADIISEDTALSARLLRLANSAMFNFPNRIDTVSHAITVIGSRQLREVILACSVVNLFKDIPEDLINMEDFWRHSVACGVTARILSSFRRDVNVEQFFTAGLLHDIGRLVLYKEKGSLMKQALELSQEKNLLLFQVESQMFGFDHARLGGMLLNEWKLPKKLVQCAFYHHKPSRAFEYPEEAAVIHAADVIANAVQYGSSGERLVPPLSADAWKIIGLPDSIIPTVLEELHKQYEGAVEFILGDQE